MQPDDDFALVADLEGVPSAMAAARDGIDAVLRDRGLRRTGPQATAESLRLGAEASAALEGEGYDLTGPARLSTELLALLPVWRAAPLQALARMHALAMRGELPDEDLGRPVRDPGRLHQLARRLLAPTRAPALVVAAIVHAEIATGEPFAAGNRIVGRAAERLVLVARGVDPASVTVPEAGHLAVERAGHGAYSGLLTEYAEGRPGVAGRWLLHCALAYGRGAELSPLGTGAADRGPG